MIHKNNNKNNNNNNNQGVFLELLVAAKKLLAPSNAWRTLNRNLIGGVHRLLW